MQTVDSITRCKQLFAAVENGESEMVSRLLTWEENTPKVTLKDKYGYTLLHRA